MKITNYKEQGPMAKVFATFDVEDYHPNVTYPNMKLKKGKDGKFWISCPSYVVSEDADGNKEWGQYPTFTKEEGDKFKWAVLKELQPFLTAPF